MLPQGELRVTGFPARPEVIEPRRTDCAGAGAVRETQKVSTHHISTAPSTKEPPYQRINRGRTWYRTGQSLAETQSYNPMPT